MKMEMTHLLCERIPLGSVETKMGGARGEGGIAINTAIHGIQLWLGQLSSVGHSR